MGDRSASYAGFLGTWVLIPESCSFEQGDPPRSGRYRIQEHDGQLVFTIEWTAADGTSDRVELTGTPDGQPRPFAGGKAIDSMAIDLVSDRDLRTRGYWQGEELMVAQYQLDDTRSAMRVTQLLRFPDGSRMANVSIYRKSDS
jgi:hypothetical protein